jgi:hypothetical protein
MRDTALTYARPGAVRRVSLAAFVALAACSSEQRGRGSNSGPTAAPPVVANIPQAAPALSATPAVDAGTRDPCSEFLALVRETLASKIPRNDAYSPDFYDSDRHCVATSDGVWAAAPRDVTTKAAPAANRYTGPTVTIRGLWLLVHESSSGARIEGAPIHFTIGAYSGEDREVSSPFDYDHDGTDEVIVKHVADGVGYARSEGSLWTVREGVIVPYERAKSIDILDVVDLDGDGRPDLLTLGPYHPDPAPACEGIDANPRPIVPLVAHSLPDGGFSMTDEVAVKFAAKECSSAPAKIEVSWSGGEEPLRAIRCARLWGASETQVTAAVHRTCSHEATDCAPRKSVCLGYETMMAWARATPPLILRR